MRSAEYRPDPREANAAGFATRLRCFVLGHDVRSWGTVLGQCQRCKHSVDNHGHRRAVLYESRYHTFPPARGETAR